MKSWHRIIGVVLVCLSVASACFAARIAESEIAIGGISFGSDESYIHNIYGNPSESKYFGKYKTISYGKSFFVTFNPQGKIHSVETTANNGLRTPSGIGVGMTKNDVFNRYGTARVLYNDLGPVVVYTSDQHHNISFLLSKVDKILQITIY